MLPAESHSLCAACLKFIMYLTLFAVSFLVADVTGAALADRTLF